MSLAIFWGKVIFLHLFVILFTGGEYLTPPRDQVPPGTRYIPPGTRYPLDQVHPSGTRYTPQTRYTPRTRYTPLEQAYPPGTRYHPPPPNQVHPLDQVHPPDQVHSPGPGTPLDQVHPPGPGAPRDQVHPPRTRYTPHAEHAVRYGQHAGGTHPTGMQSCTLIKLLRFLSKPSDSLQKWVATQLIIYDASVDADTPNQSLAFCANGPLELKSPKPVQYE